MIRRGTSDEAVRTLRTALALCLAAAAVTLPTLTALASWRAGAALAAGLVLGSGNGYLARWSLGTGPFGMLSLGRLGVLSGAGVAIGWLLGVDLLWLVMLGLAVAQLVLAGAAARETLRIR